VTANSSKPRTPLHITQVLRAAPSCTSTGRNQHQISDRETSPRLSRGFDSPLIGITRPASTRTRIGAAPPTATAILPPGGGPCPTDATRERATAKRDASRWVSLDRGGVGLTGAWRRPGSVRTFHLEVPHGIGSSLAVRNHLDLHDRCTAIEVRRREHHPQGVWYSVVWPNVPPSRQRIRNLSGTS
jgi:hypothetical protein